MSQRITGWRSILSLPRIYSLSMELLGSAKASRLFVESHIRPYRGIRILDFGCGPANILNFLPKEIEYVGIDISRTYIDSAIKNFGSRGSFHCLPVESIDENRFSGFDVVIGLGVLHHLDNQQGKQFFRLACNALKHTGRCVTIDPCRVSGQHLLAALLIKMDRGRYIRNYTEYLRLPENCFSNIQWEISHNRLRIPYTHIVLKCQKP